jgi:hypothetical protein
VFGLIRPALLFETVSADLDQPLNNCVDSSRAQVRQLLKDLVNNLQDYQPDQVKNLLHGVLSKITLSRSSTGAVSACLDYEIPIETGDKVASPRGFEPLLPP